MLKLLFELAPESGNFSFENMSGYLRGSDTKVNFEAMVSRLEYPGIPASCHDTIDDLGKPQFLTLDLEEKKIFIELIIDEFLRGNENHPLYTAKAWLWYLKCMPTSEDGLSTGQFLTNDIWNAIATGLITNQHNQLLRQIEPKDQRPTNQAVRDNLADLYQKVRI